MKRTTVFLDEAMLRRLKQVARREGRSFAAVVREAVAAYVTGLHGPSRPLPSFTGIGDSGETDVSERVDELLWADPHE